MLVSLLYICAIIAAVAVHPALSAEAAVWQLGSLGYKVGQLAFDSWRVVGFFFARNLVIYFLKPARYSQLRAPLVEQTVVTAAEEGGVIDAEAAGTRNEPGPADADV